jgi:hypothetical protein
MATHYGVNELLGSLGEATVNFINATKKEIIIMVFSILQSFMGMVIHSRHIENPGVSMCKIFLKYLNKRFLSIALSPQDCALILCTLRAGSYITEPNLEDLDSLSYSLDYFQALLFGNNSVCEVLEELLYLPEKLLAWVSFTICFAKSFIASLNSFNQPNHTLNILYQMHPTASSFPSSCYHLNQIFDMVMVKVVYFEAGVYIMTLTKVDSFDKLVIIRPWNCGLLDQLHPDLTIRVVSLVLKKSPIIPICIPDTNVKYVAILASNGTNVLVFIPNLYMLSTSNNTHTIINFTPWFIIPVVLSLIKIKSKHLHSKCDATVDQVESEKATWLNIGISSNLVVNIAFDLEDKITFRGVGNDMINVVVIQCLLTNMLYNEEINCDITSIEVEKWRKTMHRRINRLWCCYKSCNNKFLIYEFIPNASLIDALNVRKNLLAWHYNCNPTIVIDAAEELAYLQQNGILPIVHKYMWSIKEISEVAKVISVSMRHYVYIPLMSRRKRTKWDPGGHLDTLQKICHIPTETFSDRS